MSVRVTATFNCENCQTRDFIEGLQALAEHMQTAHQIDIKTTPAIQEPIAFMDGSGYWAQNYRYTFNTVDPPVVLTCTVRGVKEPKQPK